jgi:hypothetical protein
LETSLQQQKLEPPGEMKSRIISQISKGKNGLSAKSPLQKPTLVPRTGIAKYVAAVSLILLAGSVLLNLYLISQYKKTIAQNKELLDTQTQIAGRNQAMQTKLKIYQDALDLIKNPLMTIVILPGLPTSPAPASLATVYWNTESKDVYLLVNQLPVPASEKQYQLWAIVDGKPVDAGIFDMGAGLTFVKLKTILKAEAFAITLEKKGGNLTPDMNAMYVMGRVAG